jgi:hypothetical protein
MTGLGSTLRSQCGLKVPCINVSVDQVEACRLPVVGSLLPIAEIFPKRRQYRSWLRFRIRTEKRACVDRTDQLPDGQLGSSPEKGVLGSMRERSS